MNTTAESSNSNSRVLIVDDNSEFTHRVSELLQNTHHYVVCGENDPRRALETARSFHPDLILLDLGLPGGGGLNLMQKLQSMPKFEMIPIIVLSARERGGIEGEVIDGGAAAFFQKPTAPEVLLAKIRELLGEPQR